MDKTKQQCARKVGGAAGVAFGLACLLFALGAYARQTLPQWAVDAVSNTYSVANAAYFSPVGRYYAGELYTDHDFIEDSLELDWADVGASSLLYDPDRDGNGNGWSNYAEVRARCHAKRAGQEWAGRPMPTVTMTVSYSGAKDISGKTLRVEAVRPSQPRGMFAVFSVPIGDFFRTKTFELSVPESGQLCEGATDFVVTLDPLLGVAKDVHVGWFGGCFTVDLTDTSAVVDRIDIVSGRSAREATFGPGIVYHDTNSPRSAEGVASGLARNVKHIRIVPYKVKGTAPSEMQPKADENGYIMLDDMGSKPRVVAEFDLDVSSRPFIHEGDILRDGEYDLDWTGFNENIGLHSGVMMGIDDVKSVLYRVVVGYGDIGRITPLDTNTVVDALETLIEKRFEESESRTSPTPLSPGMGGDNVVYSARPTFRWTMAGEDEWASRFGSSYTAFRLQVRSGTTVVYDSGVQLAPAPDANGVYSWTPLVYANDQTGRAAFLSPGNTYTWRVTMLNAKFTDVMYSDTTTTEFTFAPNLVQEMNDHGYGSIDVCVKYFGPGAVDVDVSKTNAKMRVEAYTSPDFSGDPAARTFVTNAVSISNTSSVANATIGRLRGGTYYVRAFLDSDGDFKRSAWESWGYATIDTGALVDVAFDPQPIMVSYGTTPSVFVWIEDADTDADRIPDAWEYDSAGTNKVDFLITNGPTNIVFDGHAFVVPGLL